MSKIVISLPKELSEYLSGRAAAGGYDDIGNFIEDLILRDRADTHLSDTELGDRLQAAEDSGVSERSVVDIITGTKARLRAAAKI